MALTRSFKDTIKERASNDAGFRESLLKESVECMLGGDVETGKGILRNYINATIGFEELGTLSGKSPKSIMRMFSSSGNPTANNLFDVIRTLQEREEVRFEVHTIHQRSKHRDPELL
jgi:DNA-binding phage protein